MRNPTLLPESLLDMEYLTFIDKLESIISMGQQQKVFAKDLRAYLVAQTLVTSLYSLLLQEHFSNSRFEIKSE